MRYRHEYKYLLNEYSAALIRVRASAIMKPDVFALRRDDNSNGGYFIHNLYLDDRYDSFYYAKQNGWLNRNKYRFRYYNGDLSFIRLERKHKDGKVSFKDSVKVTQEQYTAARAGDMRFLAEREINAPEKERRLWTELAMLHRTRTLRPTADFVYHREAYVYAPGDVRVTLDSQLFKPPDLAVAKSDHLALGYSRMPYQPTLLEVKFTGFLPDVIKQLLAGLSLAYTEMSKYCIVRERGVLKHVQI